MKKTISAIIVLIFAVFFTFAGDARSEMLSLIPVYGNGKVQVRLYTDYFCPPCRAMEPKIAPILAKLVKTGAINLTFTDVPLRAESSMYADYFLRSVGTRRDINSALKIRAALDEAAVKGIKAQGDLGRYLSGKNITYAKLDNRATLKALETSIKADRVTATPTCIIEINGVRQRYSSGDAIITALSHLGKN